jgi:hypothetical protein
MRLFNCVVSAANSLLFGCSKAWDRGGALSA